MNDLEVLVRHECTECRGGGLVQHPVWMEFFSRPERMNWSQAKVNAWFFSRTGKDPDLIPDDIACPVCDGSGQETAWASLPELLQEMGLLMQDGQRIGAGNRPAVF